MVIFYFLLGIIFLSPLPYGANHDWSWSLCALLVSLASISWACYVFISNRKEFFFQHTKTILDLLIVFLGMLAWSVLQANTEWLTGLHHPLWAMINPLINGTEHAISLTPSDTMMSVMRLMSYGLVFWLSLCFSQDPERAKTVFTGLMTTGFLYSLYGLIIHLGQLTPDGTPYAADVTSTFINRNHFATYAGLSLLCTLALLNHGITASSKYHIGGNLGIQRFIEKLIVRSYLPLLIFFVIGTALILSHSRGGVSSSLLGLIVLLGVLNINKSTRNIYMVWVFATFILVGTVIFYMSSDGLIDRLNAQGFTDEARDETYELTWNAILTNPWLGFGLGSFEEVFPMYKSLFISGTFAAPHLWDYAHNSYLESIFELGFPAALALFYCFLRMAIICLRGIFVRKRDWIYPATGFAATCLVAAHANVDFSMQIPAIPYTYALLMGAACAQSYTGKKRRTKKAAE